MSKRKQKNPETKRFAVVMHSNGTGYVVRTAYVRDDGSSYMLTPYTGAQPYRGKLYSFESAAQKAADKLNKTFRPPMENPRKRRKNPEAQTFRDLPVGTWFDFIGPERASFFKRVQKISKRGYQDEDGRKYTVGSVNVKVYHVGKQHNPKKRNPSRAALKYESGIRLARAALSAAYTAKRSKNPRLLQAKISYAQGVIEALHKVGVINAPLAKTYIEGLRDLLK